MTTDRDGERGVDVDGRQQQRTEQSHFRWFHGAELCGLAALACAALVVEFSSMPQTQRPIPVQVLRTNEGQDLYIRNLYLDRNYKEELIDTVYLIVIGLVMPLLIQFTLNALAKKRNLAIVLWLECYRTWCSYLSSFSLTLLVVDLTKLYTGVLRPHFYEVCQPDDTYRQCTNANVGELRDIRGSFPSGHAGCAMSGLGSLALYVHRRFGVGRIRPEDSTTSGDRDGQKRELLARLWSFLSILPVFLALFIGTSRVHDDYHHPVDVVVGFSFGGGFAYFSHWIYFLD